MSENLLLGDAAAGAPASDDPNFDADFIEDDIEAGVNVPHEATGLLGGVSRGVAMRGRASEVIERRR